MSRIPFIPAILALLLLVAPAAGAEWLTRDNFVDPPVIEVNGETYIPNMTSITFYPGDSVKIRYIIEPKSDTDAKLIDNRYYYILTSLEDAEVSIDIRYKNGAATLDLEDFSLQVPDADSLDGIASIEIELSGFVPYVTDEEEIKLMWIKVQDAEDNVLPPVVAAVKPVAGGGGGEVITPMMAVSPKSFESDVYQDSYTKFEIAIAEISGAAPLKGVHLYVVSYATLTYPPVNPLPSDWVSFDRNYFNVPAGEKVKVKCKIKVPEYAEPGKYVGQIVVVAENDGKDIIDLKINVLKDVIPPEIEIYHPRDGEIVHEPYVVIKGVVKDNIGVKSIRINKEEIVVVPMAVKEESIEFEQEMQLEKGWNYFTIEAEDLAGNKASKTISVKFEPIPTPVPVPPTPVPPTPVPKPKKLEKLSVSIHPKYVEAEPGESVNYTITIDWYPPEWRGEMTISAVISAAGFEKKFKLPSVTPATNPPITNEITIPIPENIPPLTYKLRLEVEAGSLKASDETELKIKLKTPGFEILAGIIGITTALAVTRKIRM